MKVSINPENSIPDQSWQQVRKVRAIIQNTSGCIAVTVEGGRCIFPGGTCEPNEEERAAITREIKEETGIKFKPEEFHEVLKLETFYEDYFDPVSHSIKPRHTTTTFYYCRTKEDIKYNGLNLTDEEIEDGFKVFFADRDTLIKMILEDHSGQKNGKFFDEENRILFENILKRHIFAT